MPDDDIVRRAFLLDHSPPALPPVKLQPIRVIPPRFEPPVLTITPEQAQHVRSTCEQIIEAFRSFARALGEAMRAVVEQFQRAFPAALLVELAEAARYERRMEAHWHRTAGRPRSRRRPGRCR